MGEGAIADLIAELRIVRQSRQLSLAELARRTGCSGALLSAIEAGRARPSLSTLERMAGALGVDVGLGAGAALGISARLATLDLVQLDPEDLNREIELEARRIFDRDAASLLEGNGAMPVERGEASEAFACQVRVLLRTHAVLCAQRRREAELALVEEVHRALTGVVLAGEGVEGVTRSLARALDASVMVTDWRQTVLAEVGCSGHIDERGAVCAILLQRQDVRQALLECAGAHSAAAAGERWLVAPIVARQEILGYVWAMVARASSASGFVRTSLEQAAQVVALEMLRERAAAETERRLRRDFSHALLDDPPTGAAVLERQARQVWPRHGLPHRPVAIRIEEGGPSSGHTLERAREMVAEARPSDFTALYGGHVLLMLSETEAPAAADEVARLREALERQGLQASVVVAGVCADLDADREALRGALRLHDLLGPRPVLWLEELAVLTMLFDPERRERLREFMERALAPVAGHPLLITTLDAYYRAACNRALAARQLNVHVNTLRYRLERIESLVGGPVDDPCRAVPLRVALLARETIG